MNKSIRCLMSVRVLVMTACRGNDISVSMGIVRYKLGSYCSVYVLIRCLRSKAGGLVCVSGTLIVVFSCIFPLRKPLQMLTPPHQSRVLVRVTMQNIVAVWSRSIKTRRRQAQGKMLLAVNVATGRKRSGRIVHLWK